MSIRIRFLSVTLAMAMIASFATGCKASKKEPEPKQSTATQQPGAPAKSQFPIVEKPITLKMFGSKSTVHAEWKDMIAFKEYENMTNVKIEWDTPAASFYEERKNIMFASGDLPDAFWRGKLSYAEQSNYGGQGSLVAFDTLMDKYGPNTKAALAKYPDIKKGITTEDGKIYALPQIYTYDEKFVGYKMYLNKKWLDKLGLQLPQTTDDYYKVLKAFKEKDPNGNGKADEIPYTSDASFKLFTLLKGSWGLANRGPLNTPDLVNYDLDPKTSNVRFLPTDAGYKSILEYCAKLFSEKLIDSDMFTIKAQSADLAAKTTTDIIGSFISTNKNDVNVKFTGDFVLVPPLKGPNGDQLYTDVRSMLDEGAFSITSKNKYPNETMKWVDYFYSVEGGRLLEMGVEGKTYNKKASGGFEYSEFITKNPNGLSFNNAVGLISTAITAVSPHIATKEDNQFLTPEVIKETEEVKKYAIKENWNSLRFTNKEQEKLKELDTEINKYINEMRAKFVSGSESIDTGWTKYTETFKKLKVDEVLAIYKAATERLKK